MDKSGKGEQIVKEERMCMSAAVSKTVYNVS